jgi:hypothetical protein
MTTSAFPRPSTEAAAALRERLAGAVHTPGDATYDAARVAWNLAVDQHPAIVVDAASTDDIVATVAIAREHGLRVAPQATGHGAGALADLGEAILLKTAALTGVTVDAASRTAHVNAGTQWHEVLAATEPLGLAPLAGSAADVGVVGYTLGGGLSFLGRKYGLATRSVRGIDVALADGTQVTATADEHPELFWALRGGGGSYGVVTGMTIALYPVEALVAGAMLFPIERAREVIGAWAEWCETAPDEITTSARFMRFPPDPAIPEPIRGGAFAVIDGAYLGDAEAFVGVIAPLRDLGPVADLFAPAPISALSQLHMDPPHPVPGLACHSLLEGLDEATIDALVDAAGAESGCALTAVELRQMGGEIARGEGAAVAAISAPFSFFSVGVPLGPVPPEKLEADLERVLAAVSPRAAGTILTFAEHFGEHRTATADAAARLAAAKFRYDAGDLVLATHGPKPAGA